ncbi:hypothetical protein Dimus_033697, partial [Dionaea muscipula]
MHDVVSGRGGTPECALATPTRCEPICMRTATHGRAGRASPGRAWPFWSHGIPLAIGLLRARDIRCSQP